ncbi:hypothetical protein EMIHUDRAFT_211170 [Emiliania huxleyi CCMP1516]|uniref:Bromo domain-containing protein n=2 Tax=Emiliania huxleyi TaxID=2903 RepID=A0A0D3IWJ2_EMIH1|nr:hypothetical protein EMIHUDRAFT_211170 [Emiliania huxleyi CCMP1516]EOD15627.1 hypothetical protein EMIHUDRAFT_211170 [Emiliania huxleyi CCMP1516]|eukprot:XP_005768056.1 hypothetical protein EMIHUDRAFT_211170 [Emiliania huxleyi CCMP1516]
MSGLRVRTPKKARARPPAKDNYDEAIEEYEREQNPKAIKNRVRKAQKAAEQALVTGDKMARCGAALKLLGLRDDAYWFQEPVPVGEVPDYLDIVEEPMDFRTIAGRLAGGEYGDDALAFASDVRKVFTNAVKYNWSPDHPCNIAARAGLREFEQLFARANGNGSAPKPPPPSAQPHKKRHRDGGGGAAGSADRDRELIAGLGEYLVSCGGAEGLVDGWYTRTEVRKGGGTAGTFDTYFFTPAGKRFRSRAEIARFFQLEAAPAKSAKSQDAEERKALKSAEREAKKQQKEEAAAARQAQLDAERALRERYPVPDERLAEEEPHEPPLGPRPTPLPAGTGAVPASAVCDFLRALGPQLQLPSYSPSELAAALVESEGEPNPKLADLTQACTLALLQLVLTDKSLGEWWGVREAPNGPKAAFARASSDSKKVKWWEADAKPLLKVDLEAILASSEPTSRTRRWVAQLETVAPMRTNTGVPIRQALVAARAISSDGEVRRYLDRAISHWKGNAAGTTKFAALWLAAQVRRSRPQIFTAEGMAAVEAEEDGGVDTSLDTSEDVPPPEEEEDGASELAPSEPLSSGGDASALALPSACGGASQLEPAIRALLGQSPSLAHEVYSRLPPLQKLGLLRVLVDGACDSPHTAKAVDEAMARRRGVSEVAVSLEVQKRQEALACGGQAESDLAVELELQAANGIDSDGRDFSAADREWHRQRAADLEGIVARRDLIKHRRDTFGPARDAAQ